MEPQYSPHGERDDLDFARRLQGPPSSSRLAVIFPWFQNYDSGLFNSTTVASLSPTTTSWSNSYFWSSRLHDAWTPRRHRRMTTACDAAFSACLDEESCSRLRQQMPKLYVGHICQSSTVWTAAASLHRRRCDRRESYPRNTVPYDRLRIYRRA